jgi:hypothetical protein
LFEHVLEHPFRVLELTRAKVCEREVQFGDGVVGIQRDGPAERGDPLVDAGQLAEGDSSEVVEIAVFRPQFDGLIELDQGLLVLLRP